MSRRPRQVRIRKIAGQWRWRCRRGPTVCHADHAPTWAEARDAALTHLASHRRTRA